MKNEVVGGEGHDDEVVRAQQVAREPPGAVGSAVAICFRSSRHQHHTLANGTETTLLNALVAHCFTLTFSH